MDARTPTDHGGSGRKKNRPRHTPKGRQVDPAALDDVRALLGDKPRRRDLLIEHLHLIQDRYGYLSAPHLAALAQEMKLAQTEVYEVATFYAHFDVVKEGEVPPPPVTVRVCDSLSCAMAGAETLLADLPEKLGPGVRVVRAPCMGACDRAPVCAVGHVQVMKADEAAVTTAARKSAHAYPHEPQVDFATYRAAGGYKLLDDCISGRAHTRGHHQGRRRRRPAWARRRGLPHGAQVDAGAPGRRSAPDGGERRRRRARHLQGPALPRPRPASLHRGNADRRLGGRGGRHLRLHPRRISRADRDATPGVRARRRSGPHAACAHPSAARRRCIHLRRRVRDDRVDRRKARTAAPPPALRGAGRIVRTTRRSSRMSRRSTGYATSSKKVPPGSPATAGASARAFAHSRSPAA